MKDAIAAGQDGLKVPEDLSGADVIALYRREIERSNAIIEATPLDAAPAWWPEELFGDWQLDDLRLRADRRHHLHHDDQRTEPRRSRGRVG